MFFPTSIDYPYMDTPWATAAIVAVCALLFFGNLASDGVPEGVAIDPDGFAPHQLITAMFFHLGGGHLIGNMIFLVIFGRYVEARLGHLKFAAFYLLCGIFSALIWLGTGDNPAVGSSGAICGVIGFVLAVAPHNKLNMVLTLGGRWDFDSTFQIAVGWMIGLWIFWDLVGVLSGAGGIAFAGHLGGYAAGFGIGYALSRPELEGSHWYVEPPPKPGDRTQGKRLTSARGKVARGKVAPRNGESLAQDRAHEVVLRALGPETSPVGVIKLLMKHRGMAPEDAKRVVDRVAAGTEEILAFETVDQASRFAEDGRRLDVELNLRTAS